MLSNAKLLEKVIFAGLRRKGEWPSVHGHTISVHYRKWLSVFVFIPVVDITGREFLRVARIVDKLVNGISKFKGKIRRHSNSIVIVKDKSDHSNHCYTFWLPVGDRAKQERFRQVFKCNGGCP